MPLAPIPPAREAKKVLLPAGVTACHLEALTHDPDPNGVNVRAAPSADAPILGRLPPLQSKEPAIGLILPQFKVIGTRNGWFMIEGGTYDPGYDLPKNAPKPYAGRGWVAGNHIATGLRSATLKQKPSDEAADIVELNGTAPDGSSFGADGVTVRRLLDCSGDWFEVEIELRPGLVPKDPSAVRKGAITGWTRGYCTMQLTTCV